jgi:subtilisin family serine protease
MFVRLMQMLSLIFILLFPTFAYSEVQSASEDKYVNVLIGFKGKPDNVIMSSIVAEDYEVEHDFHPFIDVIAARIPKNIVELMAVDPSIEFIEQDAEVRAMGHTSILEEYKNAWGVDHIEADVIHAGNITGSGVRICVLDSGIDYNHKDLAANYKGGKDFVNNDDDPLDDHGHGTHVAGTIAAALGSAGVVGVAPGADLYVGKVLDDVGTGTYSILIAGIEWCVENGVNIINMSLGSSVASMALKSAVNAAYEQDVLLVAAAGNNGSCPVTDNGVIYPAKYAKVMAVAATKENDKRACFSSTGKDVEISAPGIRILSTWLDGGYESLKGTSMAAAHVSGSAALVWSSNETSWTSAGYTNGDGVWTNVEVRNVLDKTAQDLGAGGRDRQFGFGLVRPDLAAK